MQASDIAQALLEDLPAIKEDKQLSFVKSKISAIEDADTKTLATAFLLVGMQLGGACVDRHIVLLVHGIRTRGIWQDLVASLLEKHSNVKPVIVGFGYFDLFCFWFPYFFRSTPIEKVEREIRGAMKDNKGAKVSVVAHSFGTYVISRILLSKPDIQLHRLLLCGAIINNNFSWDHLTCFPTGGVINDVGTQDTLPALARTVSWGYGNTGTFGFRTHRVKDRYFNFGHSDFFNTAQIEKYWVPFIVRGEIVESEWSYQRPTPSLWLSVLHLIPMKSIVLPALISSLAYGVYKIFV